MSIKCFFSGEKSWRARQAYAPRRRVGLGAPTAPSGHHKSSALTPSRHLSLPSRRLLHQIHPDTNSISR